MNLIKETIDKSKSNTIYGIYMAVDYHPNTDFILNKMAKELGIIPDNGYDNNYNLRIDSKGNPGYKFHTTIIYSKFKTPVKGDSKLANFTTKNGSTIYQRKKPKIQAPIKIKGFGFFDTKEDGINFHVKVDSPFLKSEFQRAIAYGLPTDFPQYQPHITIKNNVSKEFREEVLKGSLKDVIHRYINTILYTNDEYIEPLSPK